MCSFIFDFACGFWSINKGNVMAAFKAMASWSISWANALKRRVSSPTNCLPHVPDGILNKLGLQ